MSENKTAILLVAFGTSVPGANVAYKNIEQNVKAMFPKEEIRWAYTSKMIRAKLKKQGEYFDSPTETLAKLGDEGYKKVAVQSFHVIPGQEFQELQIMVDRFKNMPKGIEQISLGNPLLINPEDTETIRDILLANIPAERDKAEAVLYMGHGTHHPANVYYPAMQYYLWQADEHTYMATVEGSPALDEVIQQIKKKTYSKVWIIPFMTVAGDHAKKDMAGAGENSWKSRLESNGYKVELVMKGMAEFNNIVSVWTRNLLKAYKELD